MASSSIHETLAIVERGLRRLGIDPDAPWTPISLRTMDDSDAVREKFKEDAVRRRGSYNLSEHQVARMVQLNRQGMTQSQIAQEIGCSQSAVSKNLPSARKRQIRRPIAA